MPAPSPPVLALNIHAGYACRRSGACCTAGWPIPVEADVAAAIRADETLPAWALRTSEALPEGASAILEPGPDGSCAFFDRARGRLCTIQERLGHARLPASCRHFPRVALLETDATRVTLSHFCPTAASLLFRPDVARISVVHDAAGIADRREHDGFDARHTIPPLLRPGVAMDVETCRLWEQHLLASLDRADQTPEDMLARLAAAADAIREWTAGKGQLAAHATRSIAAFESTGRLPERWGMPLASASRLCALAANSVPPGLARPDLPDHAEAADRARIVPGWAALARPLGRYLAARSFGAWSAYLGEGLRTQVAMLAVALAAVRVEAVRETVRSSRPLDDAVLHAAIRSADLLVHHLADTAVLVKSLAFVERGSLSEFLDALGLERAT